MEFGVRNVCARALGRVAESDFGVSFRTRERVSVNLPS